MPQCPETEQRARTPAGPPSITYKWGEDFAEKSQCGRSGGDGREDGVWKTPAQRPGRCPLTRGHRQPLTKRREMRSWASRSVRVRSWAAVLRAGSGCVSQTPDAASLASPAGLLPGPCRPAPPPLPEGGGLRLVRPWGPRPLLKLGAAPQSVLPQSTAPPSGEPPPSACGHSSTGCSVRPGRASIPAPRAWATTACGCDALSP